MAETQYEMVPYIIEVRKYQVFPGRIIDNIQRLLTGKDKYGRQVDVPRILATGEMLADGRLHANEADKRDLRGQYIHINLAVVDDPNGSGEMAFKNESPLVLALNSETRLVKGRLPLTNGQYEEHRSGGFILNKTEVKAFRNNRYALPDKRREFWNYTLGKQGEEYIGDVCSTLSMDFNNVMGFRLYPGAGLRLFAVYPVDGGNRSNGVISYDLGNLRYGLPLGVSAGGAETQKILGSEGQEYSRSNSKSRKY